MKGNGEKQWLLWINTILTGGAAFILSQIWFKVERVNEAQIRYEERVNSVTEAITNLNKKQDSISREHHAIFLRLDRIEKLPRP